MEKEFNLSDKTHWFYDGEGNEEDWYKDKDVKEFIKRLKEEFDYAYWAKFDYQNCRILEGEFNKEINKLAGELI